MIPFKSAPGPNRKAWPRLQRVCGSAQGRRCVHVRIVLTQGSRLGPSRHQRQDLGHRNFRLQGSAEELEQHSYPLLGWQQLGNERFESLERSLSDSHRLSNVNFRIECHDLFFVCCLPQVRDSARIECCHLIPESNNALDSGQGLDLPVLSRINKLCEQVAWEHGFHEPNGSSAGRPSETQPRREACYFKLPA